MTISVPLNFVIFEHFEADPFLVRAGSAERTVVGYIKGGIKYSSVSLSGRKPLIPILIAILAEEGRRLISTQITEEFSLENKEIRNLSAESTDPPLHM